MKEWKCPCGCELQLTPRDLANEMRLIALLGPTPRRVDLRPHGQPAGRRSVEVAEPTARGTCRSCGDAMEIFEYLAASLRLRGAPWPFCDACMQRQQQPQGRAA